MPVATISGSTTVTLVDHLAASLLRRLKTYGLSWATLIPLIAVIRWPFDATNAKDYALFTFFCVETSFIIVAVWFVVATALMGIALAMRSNRESRKMTYELNDEGIVMRDRTGIALSMPWTMLRSARETRKAFRVGSRKVVCYLPKRAFAPQDLLAVREMLREKLGAAAALR